MGGCLQVGSILSNPPPRPQEGGFAWVPQSLMLHISRVNDRASNVCSKSSYPQNLFILEVIIIIVLNLLLIVNIIYYYYYYLLLIVQDPARRPPLVEEGGGGV